MQNVVCDDPLDFFEDDSYRFRGHNKSALKKQPETNEYRQNLLRNIQQECRNRKSYNFSSNKLLGKILNKVGYMKDSIMDKIMENVDQKNKEAELSRNDDILDVLLSKTKLGKIGKVKNSRKNSKKKFKQHEQEQDNGSFKGKGKARGKAKADSSSSRSRSLSKNRSRSTNKSSFLSLKNSKNDINFSKNKSKSTIESRYNFRKKQVDSDKENDFDDPDFEEFEKVMKSKSNLLVIKAIDSDSISNDISDVHMPDLKHGSKHKNKIDSNQGQINPRTTHTPKKHRHKHN
eukprot:CAMPEP_0116911838 /NCGR_PEP_ID=MMETSP0467-20121206/15727_1 /TAXON_ID=283647 /ORGANISM="Mesodinium pulex, Strain SPMC105" /LENGTH=288 /DNA_ID=CAMNT_0004587699 /DNA_START=330 /DNA_END=1196 /DNA_ORIENTATION=+